MSEDLRGDLSGLAQSGRIVVGFSGGADSTALAHWLAGRVDRDRLLLAHVNHMLRGEEADRDEAAARAFARGQGLRFTVFRADVRALANARGMSLEECGRAVRYEFFESLLEGEQDCIVTAHTADDNLETMLLNLCRGTGLSGLCGIPYRRGRILRPLLGVTRQEIEDYCAVHGLTYVTDSTNLQPDYSRNRLRLEVLPVLREMNPRLAETMLRTAGLLRRDRDFLLGEARGLLARAQREYGLDRETLLAAPEALRPTALKLWLERKGCVDLEKKHLDSAEECLRFGGAVFLPGGVGLRCQGGLLFLSCREELEPFSLEVGPGKWELPGGRTLILEKKELNSENSPQKIHNLDFKNTLDYDIITGNLKARSRREGDRFSPAGRGLSKPLKQVFREIGMPADRRGSALLLEWDGRLVFCEGAGPAEGFQVGKDTVTALTVTVKNDEETEKAEG